MKIYASSQLLPGLDSVSFCLCIVEKKEDVSQESLELPGKYKLVSRVTCKQHRSSFVYYGYVSPQMSLGNCNSKGKLL